MNLRFRFAPASELPAIAALARHSFPGGERSPEWWRAQLSDPPYGGGLDSLFTAEADGRIVGMLQLHPLRQWIAGELLPTAGIGTVAISPVHRQRRVAGALMVQALRAAKERGDVASALYPFRAAFYQKLGYGQAGEVLQYQVPPTALPASEERLRVESLESAAQWREGLALYNAWAKRQTGQLERGERVWTQLCAGLECALFGYRAEHGALEGYALVTYRSELPRRDRYLEVEELVWTTPAARRGLYGWLASLGDQWEQLLLRARSSERLGDWLREPRLPPGAAPPWRLWMPAATLLAGPMYRLLDLPAAWALRRVAAGEPLAVALDVSDAQLPENHGRSVLELADGLARLVREGGARGTLRLDIATLSRLYTGALSPSAALHAGLLECDRPELLPALDRALLLPEPWTFDRF